MSVGHDASFTSGNHQSPACRSLANRAIAFERNDVRGEYVRFVIDDRIELPDLPVPRLSLRLARIDVNFTPLPLQGLLFSASNFANASENSMSELLRRDGKAQERADQMVPVPCQVPVQSPPGRHVCDCAPSAMRRVTWANG